MSTHCLVIKMNSDGSIDAIYVHSDGYLSEAGRTLCEYYQDEKKINDLLNLGDLSFIGPVPKSDPIMWEENYSKPPYDEYCRAYKDRGENTPKKHYSADTPIQKVIKDYDYDIYNYLWVDGEWFLLEYVFTNPAVDWTKRFGVYELKYNPGDNEPDRKWLGWAPDIN